MIYLKLSAGNISTATKNILSIFSIGLTVRLLFSFWLSKYYFGDVRFTFGDTFSYTESIKNLIHLGKFTFDVNTPDAYIYRGPIYPIFWGAHYLLFGEEIAYITTAITQSILDAASAILIYLLVMKITAERTLSLLCAAIYAIFPIFIVHVPITGTETFAVFLTLLTLVRLVYSQSRTHYLIVGLLCGVSTMTRQYLGLLVVSSAVFAFFTLKNRRFLHRLAPSAIIAVGFVLSLSPWFLRNWISLDKPTIMMGQTPGYTVAQADAIAVQGFYSLFLTDLTSVATSIARYGRDGMNDHQLLNWQRTEVDRLSLLAMKCGPSFRAVREWFPNHQPSQFANVDDCTSELVNGYNSLRAKYLDKYGIRLWIEVPIRNITKALLKTQLAVPLAGPKNYLISLIFNLRSFFVILGLCSFLFLRRMEYLSLLIFPIGLILYTSFVTRHVEMRYLVQADAVLLALSAVSIGGLMLMRNRILNRLSKFVPKS